MDNTCSLNSQNFSQSAAQRKFYQWVLKWINDFHTYSEVDNEESRGTRNPRKPDVSTLASLLQAIGFKLLSFENHNDVHTLKKDENDTSTLKVTVECGASSMRAVLELEDVVCRCPNSDHIKDASFWSISGTGPTGSTDNIVQKVEETGSNLLPRLPKDITKVLHDISYRLFEIITSEPDVNRNTNSLNTSRLSIASYDSKGKEEIPEKEIGVVRSYTQPEICINSLNSKTPGGQHRTSAHRNEPSLNRQKTWDIETRSLDGEPRPSPPKITSSPSMIAELSNSLGEISLKDELESHQTLAEYIAGAHQNLEKALKILSFERPSIASNLSPNQDHDGASVKSAPANIFPVVINRTNLNATGNVKLLPQLSHVPQKQQSVKLSAGNTAPVSKARRSMVPTLPKSTAPKSTQPEQHGSKFRRRSFYLPSSANSNLSLLSNPTDVGQKLLGTRKYGTTKTNVATESDLTNRTYTPMKKLISPMKKLISPEPRTSTTQNLETLSATKTRTPSMIKQPSKISKSMSVKITPVQSSKTDTGIAKKLRMNIQSVSKE